MCSTPRSSGKSYVSRRVSVSKTFHSSYSEMMRNASVLYEQRQEELAKQRQSLLESEETKKAS